MALRLALLAPLFEVFSYQTFRHHRQNRYSEVLIFEQ